MAGIGVAARSARQKPRKEVAVRREIVSEYVMLDGVLGEPDQTFPHLAIERSSELRHRERKRGSAPPRSGMWAGGIVG
jgi:hypothetical protein